MKKLGTLVAIIIIATALLDSCKKMEEIASSGNLYNSHGHMQQVKDYSSEVAFFLDGHATTFNPDKSNASWWSASAAILWLQCHSFV